MTPTHFSFTSAFFLGLLGLAFHRAHLFSALLRLQGMILSLFVALALWALQFVSTGFTTGPTLLFALSASEASSGLALLVGTVRTHGTNGLQCLNVLQC
uniref:NADH-ubiquinone oxidoreductase chain 4L n=1 Tax=Acrossocheilus paradoxus TaxID=76593 RepID=A0A125R6X3_ACRPD|nr:NADH dehydrogenase subunit 4L [Acrossocheilus paradoxus]AMD11930.1 NADH dehydrogenase subunit 4L [Acrossocheilus paradoxus]